MEFNRDQENIIRTYFRQGYTYINIKNILEKHGISLSTRHIQRIITNLGLKRKNINEDLDQIIFTICAELEGSGSCLGYKAMWSRLKLVYGLNVYRQTVFELLQILDPEGVEHRAKYRLKRRLYAVVGPNFMWHIDGYDKLVPYDIFIHGGIDGFSRKILWLELATTNKDPSVITHYYLKTIEKLKIVPAIIRSDRGTENNTVEEVQIVLCSTHNDNLADICFIRGKSHC